MSPNEVRGRLKGLLAFALTPFAPDDAVNIGVLRSEVEMLLDRGCAAIFAAGGTGEFFSLTLGEYRTVVESCVDQVRGRVPVIAGVGYGTAMAREFVAAAELAGADGVMVLPPYLIDAPQSGLAEHYCAVARATRLAVIVYQRGATVFEPRTVQLIAEIPNCIGFKDGVGDIDRLQRITRALGDRLVYMNGMPTAEIYALSLAECGVTTYSSAVLTFMPEIATAFASAFAQSDRRAMHDVLDRAILPFAEIRRRAPGYAVSLVKAGARLRGLPMGSVRSPLSDPTAQDEQDVRTLLVTLGLDKPLVPMSMASGSTGTPAGS